MASSSTIIIEEQGGERHTLTLTGSGLPLKGAEWATEVTAPTRWNPGNEQATQQVLGPRTTPSAWKFEWRTIRLVRSPAQFDGQSIDRASTLVDVVEGFAMRAQLLKVTWVASAIAGGAPIRVTRVGRLTKFTSAHQTSEDVDASIEFTWIGRGTPQEKASDLRGEGDLSARLNAVRSSDAVAKAILESLQRRRQPSIPNSADQFTLGQLEQMAEAPLKIANDMARACNAISGRVQQLGDVILTVRSTPYGIANRALDVANQGVSIANDFVDAMSRRPPESYTTRTSVASLMRATSYYSTAITQSELMTAGYLQLSEQARARRSALVPSPGSSRRGDQTRNQDNYSLHIPKQGETFASIAQQYYQNADLGDELAKINGVPSYTIVPPRVPLIIPTRRALENATRNTY